MPHAANRLTSLTNPFSETTAFQYDAAGRPVRQDNANGTYSTWAFDAAGQVSNVATKKANDVTILDMAYTRDAVGNPTTLAEQLLDTNNQTVHNATLTFGYDNANRLTHRDNGNMGSHREHRAHGDGTRWEMPGCARHGRAEAVAPTPMPRRCPVRQASRGRGCLCDEPDLPSVA